MLVNWLSLIAFVLYAYFTYLIAKDTQEFFVSFMLEQIKFSHIKFGMVNRSKFEIEVFSKIWVKIDNQIFQFKKGFYADDTNYILQSFTTGGGSFDLKNLENDDGLKLEDFIKKNSEKSIKFKIQIKYKKVRGRKWKKSSPQEYLYNFENGDFWLNV